MEHSIQTVKDRFNSGEPLEYVFFWGHHTKLGKMTKACFSQWFPADFVVDDVAYNCTEQYMMAEKARVFGDDDIRQKMLACFCGGRCGIQLHRTVYDGGESTCVWR